MTPEQFLDEQIKIQNGPVTIADAIETFSLAYFNSEDPHFDRANDQDMLLFQSGGPYSWAPEFYQMNMTRQFMHYDDDHYLGMQQLMMDLNLPASEHTGPQITLWNTHTLWKPFLADIEQAGLLETFGDIVITPTFSITWV